MKNNIKANKIEKIIKNNGSCVKTKQIKFKGMNVIECYCSQSVSILFNLDYLMGLVVNIDVNDSKFEQVILDNLEQALTPKF